MVRGAARKAIREGLERFRNDYYSNPDYKYNFLTKPPQAPKTEDEVRTKSQYYQDIDDMFGKTGFLDANIERNKKFAKSMYDTSKQLAMDPDQVGSRWLAKDDARIKEDEETQNRINTLTEAWNNLPDDIKADYPLNQYIAEETGKGNRAANQAAKKAGQEYDETHKTQISEQPEMKSEFDENGNVRFYTIDADGNKTYVDESGGGGGEGSGEEEPPPSVNVPGAEGDVPWYEQDPDIDVDSWYYAWRQWMIDNGLADKYTGLLDFQQKGTYDEWNQLVHDDDFVDYYQPFLDEYGDFQGYWDHFKKLAVWNALNGDWTMAQELWGSDWDTLRAVVDEAYRAGVDFYPTFEEDALQALAETYGGEYADTKALADAAREDPELAAALAPITATWAQAGTYNPDMDTSEYGNEISAKELKRIQRQNKNRY